MLHCSWGNLFIIKYTIQETLSFAVSELTIEANTGKKSVAVATLLVHSVKVAMSRHRMTAIAHGGMFCNGAI